MVTAELINYIKVLIAEGKPQKVVKANLLSQGWSEVDINQAFSQVGTNQSGFVQSSIDTSNLNSCSSQNVADKHGSKRSALKTIITIFFLIIINPVGLILMFTISKWNKWIKLIILIISLVLYIRFFLVIYAMVKRWPEDVEMNKKVENCVMSCSLKQNEEEKKSCESACYKMGTDFFENRTKQLKENPYSY